MTSVAGLGNCPAAGLQRKLRCLRRHRFNQLSRNQLTLLNPNHQDVVKGFILYDCKGQGAVQKVAKRRLDMISGNVASYSRYLNDEKRLAEIKELNELTSAVAEVSADKMNEKKRKKDKIMVAEVRF